jgi:hypothetical protein
LKNVPVVYFSVCAYLKDISGLGENKVVTITECHNISDFSSLKRVPKITIKDYSGFRSGSCTMENVQILTINRCCNFKDTSLIGKMRNFNLLNCLCISLAGLPEVSSLCISVYRGKGSYKCFQKLDGGIQKIIFSFSDIDSVRKNFPFLMTLIKRE